MPPRPISAYFKKVPVTPPSTAATSASISTTVSGAATSPKADKPASSPLTSPTSQVKTPGSLVSTSANRVGTGSGLSDAAKQAMRAAALETAEVDEGDKRAAKRLKLSDACTSAVATVTSTVTKPSTASTIGLSSSRATTRDELRSKLSSSPHKAELLRTEVETMGEDWLLALQDEFTKPYFLTLKEFITSQQATKKVFPPADEIYSWSKLCPLKDVRVVIIGQDPYHDDGQAHGLAFSVRKGVRIPPSLRNIYKEMNSEIPAFRIPKHGDLTEWAKHGVLLLNTSLTVRAHEAGSHSNKGWETFTAAVLKVVTSRLAPDAHSMPTNFFSPVKKAAAAETADNPSENGSAVAAGSTKANGTGHISGGNGVCFMAWGAHAQKMCAGVDTKKHLILKSVHPSPLAAMRGFFGNGHFTKANTWLEERYGPKGGIDWAALGE